MRIGGFGVLNLGCFFFLLRSCLFVFCTFTGGCCVCGRLTPDPSPVTYMATATAAPHRLRMGEPNPVYRETTHVRI